MNNSRERINQRRLVAMEQVKQRIKRNGEAANATEKKRKDITPEKAKKRLEQAKYELALLEKRV